MLASTICMTWLILNCDDLVNKDLEGNTVEARVKHLKRQMESPVHKLSCLFMSKGLIYIHIYLIDLFAVGVYRIKPGGSSAP